MKPPLPVPDHSRRPVALAVGLLLYAVYWLTASGAFHSIDEHAVFAVARNLLYHGRWDQSALFWGEPYLEQARIGLDGALYSKYGIGHSLLLVPTLLLARLIPGATLGSATTLLALAATALTGALLVATVRRLGYSARAGATVGLLFGLGTLAWPYARTTFSEPLVGALWSGAVLLMVGAPTRARLLWAGAALALAIAVRPASILVTPLFALPLLFEGRRAWGRVALLSLPVALVGIALLAFNQLRFGDPLQFGYSERFDGSLVAGLVGFVASLDRSLFLFCPPLVALAWSLRPFRRAHRAGGVTILAVSGATLLAYSLWPVFWGGPVWGPRYLLPVVPLLCLLLAPAAERAWAKAGWPRLALALLALAGVLMQLRGVLWNSLPRTQTLGQRAPLWTLAPRADEWDWAWRVEPLGALVALALVIAALAAWRGRGAAALVAALVATPLLLALLGRAGLGFEARPSYAAILERSQSAPPGTALLLNPTPYQEPLAQLFWFLNRPELTAPLYGLYRRPPEEAERQRAQIQWMLTQHPRFLLATEGVGPGDPTSSSEWLLAAEAVVGPVEWLDESARITRITAPLPADAEGAPGERLGELVTLESWEAVWPPDGANEIYITLDWLPERAAEGPLHTFAQLLDSEGRLVAGWDAEPQGGFAPATAWQPGESVTERLMIELPPEAASGALTLIVGLYDPATGDRLLAEDGRDALTLTTLAWPPTDGAP